MRVLERSSLTLCIAMGVAAFSIQLASAGRHPDPYGCRSKVRSELGIAPGNGSSYPGFWQRVGRCLVAAQGGSPSGAQAARSTRPVERAGPEKKLGESAKPDKLRASAARLKGDLGSESAKVHSATSQEALVPAQHPSLARPPSVPEFGRRVALVIGNGRYEHVPALPNAANDADALTKALTETGFQSVTLKTNLTRDQILSALADLAKLADSADWAAVYYSGHGIEWRGINYMIPVDAQLKVDRDVDLEAVDVSKVLSAIEGAKKLRLVILDACRDNPFLDQMKRTVATRSVSRGLGPMEPDAGLLIVHAAKHGETALDGAGKNSPFAPALINRIQTPNLELRRLFDLVRDDVLAATSRRQQPFSYGSLSGSEDFYFETK
jgi:hypothetical protein